MTHEVVKMGKRAAVAPPIEHYDAPRKAEFLLSNATDASDYKAACKAVKDMGLDPAAIRTQQSTWLAGKA